MLTRKITQFLFPVMCLGIAVGTTHVAAATVDIPDAKRPTCTVNADGSGTLALPAGLAVNFIEVYSEEHGKSTIPAKDFPADGFVIKKAKATWFNFTVKDGDAFKWALVENGSRANWSTGVWVEPDNRYKGGRAKKGAALTCWDGKA